jgi:hypothetical protein
MAAFPRLRQSQLAAFDACPLSARWSMQFEDHQFSSFPAAAGTIVHRTIARCMRLMLARGETRCPVEIAIQEFERTIRQADVPMLGDEDSVAPLPLRWIAEARVCVITWALGSEWDVRDIAGIEQRMEAVIEYPAKPYPAPGDLMVQRTITGRPDLLLIERNGWHAIVPDFKSGWGLPPERVAAEDLPDGADPDDEPISEEGYFQQRFYALLVFLTFPGIQRVTLREVYVRYMTSTSQKPTREASIHRYKMPELLSEFTQIVERFDRSYEEGVWKPSPGSHCWNCAQPEHCPILPSLRRDGRIASLEEAERVGKMFAVVDAVKRRLSESLRPWTNMHGPLAIKDSKRTRLWGPVIRQQTTRPSEAEMREAIAQGLDPTKLYRTRSVTKFEAYNPKDAPPMLDEVVATEKMLAAATRRSVSARKGARTRAARRRNGE